MNYSIKVFKRSSGLTRHLISIAELSPDFISKSLPDQWIGQAVIKRKRQRNGRGISSSNSIVSAESRVFDINPVDEATVS